MKKLILFSALSIALLSIVSCSKDDIDIVDNNNTVLDTIYMKGSVFSIDTAEAMIGYSLMWINDDTQTHTVTADNGEFSSGMMPPGSAYLVKFTVPGVTIPYHCDVHPTEKAVVKVNPTR